MNCHICNNKKRIECWLCYGRGDYSRPATAEEYESAGPETIHMLMSEPCKVCMSCGTIKCHVCNGSLSSWDFYSGGLFCYA